MKTRHFILTMALLASGAAAIAQSNKKYEYYNDSGRVVTLTEFGQRLQQEQFQVDIQKRNDTTVFRLVKKPAGVLTPGQRRTYDRNIEAYKKHLRKNRV